MTNTEIRSISGISAIMACRMLGLFMILPVFVLYAHQYEHVTPQLVGIAIGIYGLTQAFLQIPLGLISDHIGRKPVIAMGLILFAAGGVIAATADSIYVVIVGRALQGAGAIASTLMALAADLTQEQNRMKSMAIIGMSIGGSFGLAFLFGPLITDVYGLSGVFWTTVVLAGVAMVLLFTAVPTPRRLMIQYDSETVPVVLKKILCHPELIKMDIGVLILHFTITASFLVVPSYLSQHLTADATQHTIWYLLVLVLSFAIALPIIIFAEAKRQLKRTLLCAIGLLMLAEFVLFQGHDVFRVLVIGLLLFFIAFNILEASLPSIVAKLSPPAGKGTAMGVFSTAQFFGAFLGGTLGGWMLQSPVGGDTILLVCVGLAFCWFVVALMLHPPKPGKSLAVRLTSKSLDTDALAEYLSKVAGVVDVVIIPSALTAYLKVDEKKLDKDKLYRHPDIKD